MKKAPKEFGREGLENKLKQRKWNRTITIVALLAGIALVAVIISNISRADASSGPVKNKKEKSKSRNKDKAQEQVEQPGSPGITVAKKWDMPKILTEISGLAYAGANRFACVQDELGTIFIYNTATSAIEKEIPFAEAGDYEGVTLVNETAWVVRADGRLFEVNNINSAKPVVKEYSTHLTVKHNVEGLCYDKKNNRLLLTIKDAEPGSTDYKGIYSFDLATKKMPVEPVFKIDLKDVVFANETAKKNKSGGIMPSAIAIHPLTNDMYITDGRKAKLLITNSAGTIKKLHQLSSNEFAQPEGITFTPTGEMFISNEGPKQAGNILKVETSTE